MHFDFFIASRWRNKEAVLELTEKLRAKGKSVYCFVEGDGTTNDIWAKKDTHSPEEYMKEFETTPDWQNDPAIKHMFETDMNALKNTDTLLLLLPAGKSAHIEAGTAYGLGKKCIVIGEQKEAESLYLIFDEMYSSVDKFLETI